MLTHEAASALFRGFALAPPPGPSAVAFPTAAVVIFAILLVYAYACVSSYVHALLMTLARAVAPAALRGVVHILLALAYLSALVLFLRNAAPPVVAAYAAGAVFPSPSARRLLLWLPTLALLNLALVFVGYVKAARHAPDIRPNSVPPPPLVTTPGERAWRAFLIALNASVNMLLGTLALDLTLFPRLGPGARAVAVFGGLVPALLNLTALFVPSLPARARPYARGLLGWLNWLMPASWPVVAAGWALFVLNLLGNVLLGLPPFPFAPFFEVVRMEIHWPTGTIFTEGGAASNLWLQGPIASRGAYDMGGFGFVHSRTTSQGLPRVTLDAGSAMSAPLLNHESGHNLSLAAFGSFFHAVGACDENLTGNPPEQAYAERLAESHDPVNPRNDPIVPLWI
ncbi:MAG TPA: hypothetical protein VE642_02620 [Pyrinomonadaceae bacterium]|nr:hypothetical protein [Pyrinomonadaceae bacterium]